MAKETKSYVERDVSWMFFNHRILQEAKKEQVPLLERLSFLGIYSNNLDEFFRVRVASINRFLENPKLDKATKTILKDSLKTINKLNKQYSVEYSKAVNDVRQSLELQGIRILSDKELNDEQKKFLTDFFYSKLKVELKMSVGIPQVEEESCGVYRYFVKQSRKCDSFA